jgi:catalase-peroxidase
VESFSILEPRTDGFRNYLGQSEDRDAAQALVDKAALLGLSAPEMTVLLAGLRVLDANHGSVPHGVLTNNPGTLTHDFFVHLVDGGIDWKKGNGGIYQGIDVKTEKVKWTGTAVDLLIGSHSQLRAIAEVYAADDAKEKFVQDFVDAWVKVMRLDRFDLQR